MKHFSYLIMALGVLLVCSCQTSGTQVAKGDLGNQSMRVEEIEGLNGTSIDVEEIEGLNGTSIDVEEIEGLNGTSID